MLIDKKNIDPKTIDLVIVATATPERKFPSTAVLLQNKLKIQQGFAFDINAACTGFSFWYVSCGKIY